MTSTSPDARDDVFDVVVVGAGAGGLTAASTAAAQGCSVLLLEQADVVGGTTAISGGMVWIPANDKAAAGRSDSLDAARVYLAETVPGLDRTRLETFLANGSAAVRDLEGRTSLRLQPVVTYPDYYPDLPGATPGGRVLEPVPFDARALGRAFALVRDPLPEFMLFGGMMISRQDIPHLRRITKSPRSAFHVAKLLFKYGMQRLGSRRGTTLYLGNALVARLLKSAIDLGVTIRTGTTVKRLEADAFGRISLLETSGASAVPRRVHARRGVVLATGGISHDDQLRRGFVPEDAGALTATVSGGKAPCGARLATAVGGQLSAPTGDGAFWVPASRFKRDDGSQGVYPHTVTDRAKPGLIAVDCHGLRFVNEAVSYHEFVRAQLANSGSAIPAWLICDSRFLWKYGLGKIKPFTFSVGSDIKSGYLRRANSPGELAASIGVPPAALEQTVAAFNRDAERGEDRAFGRGSNVYQRSLGDADVTPNPCVAPLKHSPFYAVAVYPADLGMSAGLVTDDSGRVLAADGMPIRGLYACGNDMASIMNGAYPGPGITLGPALTFGWLAGRQVATEPIS